MLIAGIKKPGMNPAQHAGYDRLIIFAGTTAQLRNIFGYFVDHSVYYIPELVFHTYQMHENTEGSNNQFKFAVGSYVPDIPIATL